MATNTNKYTTNKKELSHLLTLLNSQNKEIQFFLTELQQAKDEIEQIQSDPSPTMAARERLTILAEQFNQNELNPGGRLAKKLEKFSTAVSDIDKTLHHLSGKVAPLTVPVGGKKKKNVKFA